MSLSERGAKVAPRTKFEQWIDSLNDEHRTIILGWLRDPDFTNAQLLNMIRDDDPDDGYVGYRANHATISNWRKVNNVPRR